jgi:hypothetical protein
MPTSAGFAFCHSGMGQTSAEVAEVASVSSRTARRLAHGVIMVGGLQA